MANQFKVSREDQDQFALKSHEKAIEAIKTGKFKDDIIPINVTQVYLDEEEKRQVNDPTLLTPMKVREVVL